MNPITNPSQIQNTLYLSLGFVVRNQDQYPKMLYMTRDIYDESKNKRNKYVDVKRSLFKRSLFKRSLFEDSLQNQKRKR